MSISELITVLIAIFSLSALAYAIGWYGHEIKMCNAYLKIIRKKWKPLITKEHYENDYEHGKLAGIAQVFEWIREEDI